VYAHRSRILTGDPVRRPPTPRDMAIINVTDRASSARDAATPAKEQQPTNCTSIYPPQQQPDEWIMDSPLPQGAHSYVSGWLNKQHQSTPGRWARRWFSIDDRKGRISYAHREGSRKVSCSIPLQELTVCTSDLGDRDFCFVISCSPLRLVLSAPSEADRSRWVDNLQLRVDVWKAKAIAEGPRVAQVLDLDMVSNGTSHSDESRGGESMSWSWEDATGSR